MTSGGYDSRAGGVDGADPEKVKAWSSVDGLEKTTIPLFFTRAESDRCPWFSDTASNFACTRRRKATRERCWRCVSSSQSES